MRTSAGDHECWRCWRLPGKKASWARPVSIAVAIGSLTISAHLLCPDSGTSPLRIEFSEQAAASGSEGADGAITDQLRSGIRQAVRLVPGARDRVAAIVGLHF